MPSCTAKRPPQYVTCGGLGIMEALAAILDRTGVFASLHAAVIASVQEVHGKADHEPDHQPYPGVARQTSHHEQGHDHSNDGREGYPRRPERPRLVRVLAAQRPYPG